MKTYPSGLEEKLGFTVVRRQLKERVRSGLGERRLREMKPARTTGALRGELARVEQYAQALRYDESIPLRHVVDVRKALRRAMPEDAYLPPEDLRTLRLTLITLRRVKRFFERRDADYPALAESTGRITPLEDLEREIERLIDEDGRLRDDASQELLRLRRQIAERQDQLRQALRKALQSAIRRGYATEEQPTMRGGRRVIPVRAEAKRKVKGFVHDTSASGQTVYIEPATCLDLGNAVRELEAQERREVERILREATGRVRDVMDVLQTNVRVLAALDLLQAKARLALRLDAVVPELSEDGVIDIQEGRNPVLQLHLEKQASEGEQRPVVPLDLKLGGAARTLVITGPNAGGKTVALKTVGLFALMLAYGLPLPLAPSSRFALFDQLIADIGDEQSIEEDLSTFSSHVANLRHMLAEAETGTLVLIDEAGTGTDPQEGGALAQAVLEELTRRGARTIATTHHGTLKVYAHEAEHIENGSMEFDQETLRPTYRFRTGVPGSSYAFEIAERLGLPEGLLQRARTLAGEGKSALEDLIGTFEARTQKLQRRLEETEHAAHQAEAEKKRYADKVGRLEKEKAEIRGQALEEAERIVQGANARIERTIREIKEAEAEKEATSEAREAFEAYREDLTEQLQNAEAGTEVELPEEVLSSKEGSPGKKSSEETARKKPSVPPPAERNGAPAGPIEEGDQVVLKDSGNEGEVLELEGEEAVVLLGSMRMRVELDQIVKTGGGREQQVTVGEVQTGSEAELPALEAKSRIDLRGLRVSEARSAVEELIDQAVTAGLRRVEILHGKGTGALRTAIGEYLEDRPEVASFEKASIEQGGAGVTRVELK